MPGPLQVIAVSFGPGAGADFEGRVLAEVDRLQGRGVSRLLDVLFVAKDEEGKLQQLVVGDDDDFGALLASVVPLDGAGLVEPSVGEGLCGFDPGDAWALAQSLRPGSALAFLLIEHAWAQPLFAAIADTGGALVGEGFLTSETGLLVGAAVAAMEQTAGVIAAAEAARSQRHTAGPGRRSPSNGDDGRLRSDPCRRRGARRPIPNQRRRRGPGSRPRRR